MALFIHGMGNISAQDSWDGKSVLKSMPVKNGRLTAIEPDYTSIIDPKLLRRMSRVIRMGMAASSVALKQSGVTIPDAIITGTGYGCLDDTGIFLTKMIENSEVALNPTPFIQSTHNTIGSQIALLLQCQGYNQTYAHGAFSFESGLLDALLFSNEEPDANILVGAVDEITDYSHQILNRFDLFNQHVSSSYELIEAENGAVNGEGSAFFVGSGKKREGTVAQVTKVLTFYQPDLASLRTSVLEFCKGENIDVVLSGKSFEAGNSKLDIISKELFSNPVPVNFKQWCGEYPVSSAFACWLGVKAILEGPVAVSLRSTAPVKTVLVFNQQFDTHFSLIMIKAC